MSTTSSRPRRPHRRVLAYALAASTVAVVVAAVTAVLPARSGTRPATTGSAAVEPTTAGPVGPLVALSPTPSPSVTASPPLLRMPGPVPSAGRGTFGYDDQPGELLGRAGTLRRYRVAVETGSGEDVRAFGAEVEQVLAAPGSWIGSGRLRLQRVPGNAPHDFTVYLATPGTAGRMCAAGGVNIRVGGRPYTSCRAPGKVILNLDRWRTSVPHFVDAGVPLTVYRAYVVNHEVGHELGYRHERCPKPGRPAPVMMQQTLFLKGCVANPWPFLDGQRYAGPRL
ncbi:hypothetical protein CA850_07690 [Micromonospora echinospora]|uniref:DUF3152 domain-containing protein n=1 Tax=Micromonospora echinospora TaxID=1877 RepID=A0A1C4X5N0_MICEC|nr:DUF3152 domain-containing protein [Micromonospora echinospora]OZV82186.1 hypothetical protein CA850_07690 [Micromonospora echinospora]SCF03718.1 Protein of unknown function [Micromonospora echinospora]